MKLAPGTIKVHFPLRGYLNFRGNLKNTLDQQALLKKLPPAFVGTAQHRSSIHASHPAILGSILGALNK